MTRWSFLSQNDQYLIGLQQPGSGPLILVQVSLRVRSYVPEEPASEPPLAGSTWERVAPFVASAEWRSITRSPLMEQKHILAARRGQTNPSYELGKPLPPVAEPGRAGPSRAALGPAPSSSDRQRHSADVASFKKKALVHQIERVSETD